MAMVRPVRWLRALARLRTSGSDGRDVVYHSLLSKIPINPFVSPTAAWQHLARASSQVRLRFALCTAMLVDSFPSRTGAYSLDPSVLPKD